MQLHFLGKNCSYKNNFRSEFMWFLFPKKSQSCFSWKVHYGKYVKYGWCLFIALLGGQLLAGEFCYLVVVNITVTASVLKLRRLHSGSYVYFKSSRLQASNLCLVPVWLDFCENFAEWIFMFCENRVKFAGINFDVLRKNFKKNVWEKHFSFLLERSVVFFLFFLSCFFLFMVCCLIRLNLLSTNHTKWSNTLKQFVGNSRRIVWLCLTILWGLAL